MKDIHNLLNKYETFLAKAQELAKNRNNGIDLCDDKHESELYTKLFIHSNIKNMKGKDRFTEAEISKLKMLIKERCNTPSEKQKAIRDKMRAVGFYGSDFGIRDMTIEKFEGLIGDGCIKIIEGGTAIISHDSAKKQMQATPQEKITKSLPPLIDKNSEILIVGTMPGAESLRKGEYYASNNNSFWKIIDKLLNKEQGFNTYPEKVACLKQHHIALWDVIASCNRQGSADNRIMNEELNDMDNLLEQYPRIRKIICNGKKASSYLMVNRIKSVTAESTSNANAKPLNIKFEDWKSKLEM